MQTLTGAIFARFLSVFVCSADDSTYPVALILPLDAPLGMDRLRDTMDKELAVYRVRARQRREAEFISVKSIIRGAVLVEDSEREGEFLVLDNLNGDMLLRMRKMFPSLSVSAPGPSFLLCC